jgi:hypothetical protein
MVKTSYKWWKNREFQNLFQDLQSLTLRKERRLRVFENRVLRRIFGPTRDMVTGKWRKIHNE